MVRTRGSNRDWRASAQGSKRCNRTPASMRLYVVKIPKLTSCLGASRSFRFLSGNRCRYLAFFGVRNYREFTLGYSVPIVSIEGELILGYKV